MRLLRGKWKLSGPSDHKEEKEEKRRGVAYSPQRQKHFNGTVVRIKR